MVDGHQPNSDLYALQGLDKDDRQSLNTQKQEKKPNICSYCEYTGHDYYEVIPRSNTLVV